MKPKAPGLCTKCDAEVFEILKRDPETRVPISVGAAHDDAVRVSVLLKTGSIMDLTFCAECAAALTPADLAEIWQRVMISWIAQSGAEHPFVKTQTDNAILGVYRKQLWKDISP